MRCDVNLSVKPKGSDVLGTRTEMKNLNSFKSVARAIKYESDRQIEALENGEKIVQETRKWDDEKGKSFSMRSKEDSQDYRYFPDPDLLTVKLDKEIVSKIEKELPLSQEKRIEKYMQQYGLSSQDAKVLTSAKEISDFFDKCLELLDQPKEVANWILTDVLKLDTSNGIPVSAENLVNIIKLMLDKKISRINAKILLEKVVETGTEAFALAQQLDMLSQVSNDDIFSIVDNAIQNNPKAVLDYSKTPDKVCQYFMGCLMKETKGKADVPTARGYIIKKLDEITKNQ